MNRVTYISLIIFLNLYTALGFSHELVRPMSLKDYESEDDRNVTAEWAERIVGAEVAWADYSAIRRDFPDLLQLSDSEINAWLLENFAFIGEEQSRLNDIRNTPIPTSGDRKIAIRPSSWVRSGVLEAKDKNGRVLGMVDLKGFGHGSQSYKQVRDQLIEFNSAMSFSESSTLDKIRTKDHSDGLMSFGEAIAEVSRQQAAQRLFEIENVNLETVESYAIIALPFDILKDNGQKIPAALYLRQAHIGRSRVDVPKSIYEDPHGGKQSTKMGTAVDFGGVIITHEKLKSNYRTEGNDQLKLLKLEDAQKSKPWVWGHEVALAWKMGDKDAVHRHIREMLLPIESEYQNSKNVQNYQANRRIKIRNISKYSEIAFNKRASELKLITNFKIPLSEIENNLSNTDPVIRSKAAQHLEGRVEAKALALIELALQDKDRYVRNAGAQALQGRTDRVSFRLIMIAIHDEWSSVRFSGIKAFRGRNEEEIVQIIKHLFDEGDSYTKSECIKALQGRNDAESLLIIEKGIKSIDSTVLYSACRALAGRQDAGSLTLIESVLNHKDTYVRSLAVFALKGRNDERSLALIEKALNDPDKEVVTYALRALSSRNDSGAIQMMERFRAAFVKSRVKDRVNAEIMFQLLKDYSTCVKVFSP